MDRPRVRIFLQLQVMLLAGLLSSDVQSCSCRSGPFSLSWLDHYDLVFSGRARDSEVPAPRLEMHDGEWVRIRSTMDLVAWTFDVEGVWKGDPSGAGVVVHTPYDEVSCGYPFKTGERYLVFARTTPDGNLKTNLCAGTERWSLALAQRYVLGEPDRALVPVDPAPTLDELAARLFDSEPESQEAALDFWSDSDCGLEYLSRRLEELDLCESRRELLARQTARMASRNPQSSADGAPPGSTERVPSSDFVFRRFANYRACSEEEWAWVRQQIGRPRQE